jgi:hypothetical protein
LRKQQLQQRVRAHKPHPRSSGHVSMPTHGPAVAGAAGVIPGRPPQRDCGCWKPLARSSLGWKVYPRQAAHIIATTCDRSCPSGALGHWLLSRT